MADNPPPAPPQPPSPPASAALTALDRFWLDAAREMTKESVKALEEAAKQVIAVAGFSQSVYFAVVSFGDLKKALDMLPTGVQICLVAALTLPLLFWIGSLAFAIRVFKPETYASNLESPDAARDTYREIVAYKQTQLGRAHRFLVLGFLPLVVNIVAYLLLAPVKPE